MGLGDGDVCLDPSRYGQIIMCRHPWPLEFIGDLVSVTKPGGKLTGSDLELAALVLHEANFLVEVPVARMV